MRAGPSSAKTACSDGHLEAGLGTLSREIKCFNWRVATAADVVSVGNTDVYWFYSL